MTQKHFLRKWRSTQRVTEVVILLTQALTFHTEFAQVYLEVIQNSDWVYSLSNMGEMVGSYCTSFPLGKRKKTETAESSCPPNYSQKTSRENKSAWWKWPHAGCETVIQLQICRAFSRLKCHAAFLEDLSASQQAFYTIKKKIRAAGEGVVMITRWEVDKIVPKKEDYYCNWAIFRGWGEMCLS